jgi:hypothetical protein
MNGAYKISQGYYTELESLLKNLTYLFVFGMLEFFFELYRKLSQFDQTDQLRFVYKLADRT